MGMLTLLLPENLGADAARELERAFVAGGPDTMPWPSRAQVEDRRLIVRRDVGESGVLLAPWDIPQTGRLMGSTATLMERELPYDFQLELARGKVNQLRCQAEEWRASGLAMSSDLLESIRHASLGFGQAILEPGNDRSSTQAQEALVLSYRAAHELAQAYVNQVFRVRHERDPHLDVASSCRLGSVPTTEASQIIGETFNRITIPFTWSAIAPTDRAFCWDLQDSLLDWADAQSIPVAAGPLIDFASAQIPAWLWAWERDLSTLARFAAEYVAAAIKRYRDRIRRWHLVSGSNNASVLSLTEEELLRLTVKVAQVARQVDPGLELVVGIAQPWGDYLATQERAQSPFLFAETLIRTDLNLSALDIELVMGVTPRGSYCRDLLETSRLLDLYALLGVPLLVTMGYPSAASLDTNADPEQTVGNGYWRGEFDPARQAQWTADFSSLVLCKPYVQSIGWTHLADAAPHQFPNCGLIDPSGKEKPALETLRQLRKTHLH
jgi:hypothetical protein